VGRPDQLSRAAQVVRLARGAADWLIDGHGVDREDPCLYHGLAGVVLALHEAHQHFGDDRYRQAVARGADALSAQVDVMEGCSLYFGLADVAFALRALGRDAAAAQALNRVRDRFDGQRWNEMFELFMGNAGIGLGALHAGDLDLAVLAVPHTSPRPAGPRAASTGRYGPRRPGRTRDEAWTALSDRCWRTICESGLPRRIRPGFWDNNARCCGTVGVLALACDRIAERGEDFDFANVLVDDLAARATADNAGVRWSNHEHRATPSDLEPRAGWAMGNAGIIPELLRYARLSEDGAAGYAVHWPDHPATAGGRELRGVAARRSGGGGWWRTVAVEYPVAVRIGHSGGAVGVEGDDPAPLVHQDEVVEAAEQQEVGEFGRAASGTGNDVVDLTRGGQLVAPWGSAVPVAQDDRAAQVRRDRVGGRADVQGQAHRGRRGPEGTGAQH